MYNLFFFVFSLVAFNSKGPLIYGLLLLDIIKRSSSLQNIIKSITRNLKNLFLFSYLGCIIMYIYGIWAYSSFKDYYDETHHAYSDSFILTVTSTIKESLRNGGGVSEALKPMAYSQEVQGYWELIKILQMEFWKKVGNTIFIFNTIYTIQYFI
ncbi:hypothetical protein IMG5_152130 [Ichthyophthirius multifiliis]|uniref:Ion transport domain-containing protein n=1 Tax=Ichthyophthirius multifiliis TaxID=5932 RepID=G0QYT7_ICHMU|nr:hypothetical protein IMG5_152130 [Ichthyophthirius multifiliis]EGR29612.1 hypothetical protein IMG5_152130 [Ichthyophthirius multifiliis]|eukprot:XP_004030848.1 hypothetical protein IMG5_152130 [Ichthyophthirius multifiliis]